MLDVLSACPLLEHLGLDRVGAALPPEAGHRSIALPKLREMRLKNSAKQIWFLLAALQCQPSSMSLTGLLEPDGFEDDEDLPFPRFTDLLPPPLARYAILSSADHVDLRCGRYRSYWLSAHTPGRNLWLMFEHPNEKFEWDDYATDALQDLLQLLGTAPLTRLDVTLNTHSMDPQPDDVWEDILLAYPTLVFLRLDGLRDVEPIVQVLARPSNADAEYANDMIPGSAQTGDLVVPRLRSLELLNCRWSTYLPHDLRSCLERRAERPGVERLQELRLKTSHYRDWDTIPDLRGCHAKVLEVLSDVVDDLCHEATTRDVRYPWLSALVPSTVRTRCWRSRICRLNIGVGHRAARKTCQSAVRSLRQALLVLDAKRLDNLLPLPLCILVVWTIATMR